MSKSTTFAVRPHGRKIDWEKEEKELEDMIAENRGDPPKDEEDTDQDNQKEDKTPDNDESDKELTAEEKTFKKRYGDLRRHSQKQKEDFDNRIKALETQLEEAGRKSIKLPKTEEEITEWANKYPDVAKIVETIAMKKAREQTEALEARMKDLDTSQHELAKDRAMLDLAKMHSDWDEIREADEFHEWAEMQPKVIQDALYENETDARSIARALDLFKADTGWGKSKGKKRDDDSRKAAETVDKTSEKHTPDTDSNKGKILESDINKMTSAEYARREDEINRAIAEGNIIYDISGGAR